MILLIYSLAIYCRIEVLQNVTIQPQSHEGSKIHKKSNLKIALRLKDDFQGIDSLNSHKIPL